MIDIVIESPFLPKRKIKLDETKWTIEKLTNIISSKIKVLGKSIDKDVVCYKFVFENGETFEISESTDCSLCLASFKEKYMSNGLTDNLLNIKVTFSDIHFSRVRHSIKLLESDTLDSFIERRKSIGSLSDLVVNLENSDLKTLEMNDAGIDHFSNRYIEYKLSVNDKWKNILKELKNQKIIGFKEKKIELDSEKNIDIEKLEVEVNSLSENESNKNNNKPNKCCCFGIFALKKTSKSDLVKSNFHYDFESSNVDDDISTLGEDVDETNNYDDLSYHDENIMGDNLEGRMFYTWDDEDDFLLD